jgi:protein-disulfide isomerase
MRLTTVAGGVVCAVALWALPYYAAQESKPDQSAVAAIDGKSFTYADLDQKEGAKLLQARDQYYRAERQALDALIDDNLLQAEADRQKITVDELLKRNVEDKVKDPTDDQLEVFYEGLNTDKSFADVKDKILESIRQRRIAKLRGEYIKSLRQQANIQIFLDPPTEQVAVGDAPLQGPRTAPVTIIEFADYECPYCQKIHPELKKLESDFPDKVAIAYKDFPLPMHKHAEKAAEAARCAGDQGKYWEFHDTLFEKGGLDVSELKETAIALKLDSTKFDKCLDSSEEADAIQKTVDEGQRLGLSGTPSFFINGHFVSGATNYATLREMVEQELSRHPAPAMAQGNK